ncbi:hypothetical protein [Actinoplanes sp. NPDC049265]|uniref:hypothetical protein n=1 Tax=Actinoplanes sp. NPDC049265 TaxID=3363902 RepID=UPI003716AA8D
MLRTLDITATIALAEAPFHNLYFGHSFELSLDCFICERQGRTTFLTVGGERAVCTGDRSHGGKHFAPARVAGFDPMSGRDRKALHVVVQQWWAPFRDAKRDQASAPVGTGWVRFELPYTCPDGRNGRASIQSNLVLPHALTCEHCDTVLATGEDVPKIVERL